MQRGDTQHSADTVTDTASKCLHSMGECQRVHKNVIKLRIMPLWVTVKVSVTLAQAKKVRKYLD